MPLCFSILHSLIILFAFFTPLLLSSPAAAYRRRRILHQSFLPQDSTPPLSPPASTPPPYPFTTSTPLPDAPFFPSFPSPPPLPPPPSLDSFPANVSSLSLPHSSKPKRASSKLIAAAIVAVAAALLALALAFYCHFRKRSTGFSDTKTHRSDNSSRINYGVTGDRNVPKLQRPSQTSSEFLYLGTLVNAHAAIGSNRTGHRQNLSDDDLNSRKMGSPELRPLPPLSRQTMRSNQGNVEEGSGGEDDDEEFYSPRGSLLGRESSIGAESASRRKFSAVELEKFGGLCSSSSYSSSSSASGSPERYLSNSISPPVSSSPKEFRLKSPELVVIKAAPSRAPPPLSSSSYRMPLVKHKEPQSPSQFSSFSPSPPSSTSPERVYSRSRNSSPRISNSSDEHLDASQLIGTPAPPVPSPQPVSAPPPPPPPPLSVKNGGSPRTPAPQARKLASEPPVLVAPLRPMSVESPSLISPMQLPSNLEADAKNDKGLDCEVNSDDNEEILKPKLKPLHWDKVIASSDREMVWDQFKSSSFKLNEEMIKTLFVVKAPTQTPKEATRGQLLPLRTQENRVLDPKKSQNIAILLRALNVTMEEVCDALVEGNADNLGTELLESLLKMVPTKEEERKLKECTDDSPIKLGPAEKFLKAVLDIPFAFKRVETLLYVSNFESELEYLKSSFQTLEAACEELRNSRMFLKLLEAVLKTGNRMNVGTNRGDAHAFKLDTLLKLVDIKGADGKTTLLHFVVQEIIRSEGARLHSANQNNIPSANDDVKCRKLGLQVVSSLGLELTKVKKAAAMDAELLHTDVTKLSNGLGKVAEVLRLVESTGLQGSNIQKFSDSLSKFKKLAEEEIIRIQAQESVALSLVKEITEYFHGNSAKEEAHPFRIFMVVRDFLAVLDRVCKEVGSINDRTAVSAGHNFPIPVNPTQIQTFSGFPGRQPDISSDDDSS